VGLCMRTFETAMHRAEQHCRTLLQESQHEWQSGEDAQAEPKASRALQTGRTPSIALHICIIYVYIYMIYSTCDPRRPPSLDFGPQPRQLFVLAKLDWTRIIESHGTHIHDPPPTPRFVLQPAPTSC
jgi:hypothetical protein